VPLKKPLVASSLVALLVGSVASFGTACSSSDASPPAGAAGAADSAPGSGGDDGSSGSSTSNGGSGAAGPAGDAGAPGEGGALGEGGAPPALSADALPASTFLYVYSEAPDSDLLIARDFVTGKERVVTDLRGDDSDGWEIWGHAISPDRKRIVLASLFGPTAADNDTKLATRRIWTLASDGTDFTRLTPVFENTGEGRSGFNISVQDPIFTADGGAVIYDFGNWWYEGTKLQGGSSPWIVSTSGDVPALLPTGVSCSVINPSVNPVTGDVLVVHSVCVNDADEGIFLYSSTDDSEPLKLVARSFGPEGVDPALEKASWLGDGSGFVFVGTLEVTRGDVTDTANSLLSFDMTSGEAKVLLIPEADTGIRNAAISADGTGIVYCLYHDGVYDLHAIDLSLKTPEDAAITNDGKSCSPVF
jgi:hypothetical protein